ncbi:hypothetical protein SORBI_3003G254850 [Sorghum bicolor]|uniref:NAC domain-containing protein n=1 Tax=Sorghum bicolor TaxID=4558 RepID=A0A1W0VYW1_SORBI|nr:hypothetical protein SORBI_3003G254850 [Sorghum bicolor]
MAGSPPKPPPPIFAAGSSSPKPPPPTFDSHPSYVELMNSYLRPRVVSGTKVDFIHETDLYGADPNQLTGNLLPATAKSGEEGSTKTQMKRDVDTGRKGGWPGVGSPNDVLSNGQRIGQRRYFAFHEKAGGDLVKSAWRMRELRLDTNEGGQEEGSSDLLALCKVYHFPNAEAGNESSMAVAKADAEAPAASAVTTAAGPGRKRKAGDTDSGTETVASSPARQKKADGEGADAATTGEKQ